MLDECRFRQRPPQCRGRSADGGVRTAYHSGTQQRDHNCCVPQCVPPPRDPGVDAAGDRSDQVSMPLSRLDLRFRRRARRHPILGRYRERSTLPGRSGTQRAGSGGLPTVEQRRVRQSEWRCGTFRRLRRAVRTGTRTRRFRQPAAGAPAQLGIQGELETGDGQLGGLPPRVGSPGCVRQDVR